MKNRTIIGVICLVLAIIVTFVVAPLINRLADDTEEVVIVLQDIKQGSVITEEMVELAEFSKDNLPENPITDLSAVVGKYAASNLYAGDCVTDAKLTADGNTAEDVFATLDGSKVAISVTVNDLASAVSGKLQNGDIITIFVLEQDADKAIQPGALTYMQVVTTTTADGIDQDSIVKNEDGSYSLPSTVTVLANAEQAKLLATYEENATIHVAFVYRGNKKVADQFLAVQDAYFVPDEAEPEIPDEEEPVVIPLEGDETDG